MVLIVRAWKMMSNKMKSINQQKVEIIKRLIELNKQLDKLTRYY